MAIPDGHRTNFETLERAFQDGRVCLLECQDRASGDSVPVILPGASNIGHVYPAAYRTQSAWK